MSDKIKIIIEKERNGRAELPRVLTCCGNSKLAGRLAETDALGLGKLQDIDLGPRFDEGLVGGVLLGDIGGNANGPNDNGRAI